MLNHKDPFSHGKSDLQGFMPDECVIKIQDDEAIIQSASLKALITLIYHPSIFYDSFYPQLILTFHNIGMKTTEAQDQIYAFLEAYDSKMSVDGLDVSPESIIKHTVEFFKVWNNDFTHDFFDDNDANEIREKVHDIFSLVAKLDLMKKFTDDISFITHTIDRYYYDVDAEIAKKDYLTKEPDYKKLNIDEETPFPLKATPQEMVNHFTYVELQQFASIERFELLQCSWSKNDKLEKAPHIVELTKHFNDTSLFINSTILSTKKYAKKRANIIEAWIKIMDAAYTAKNFNLLFEINGALSNPAIARLKGTWSLVSSEVLKRYAELCEITQPSQKFKRYRHKLKNCKVEITLPYVGLWLNSMSLVDNDNSTYVTLPNGEKGINFHKQRLLYENFVMVLKRWGSELTFCLDKTLLNEIQNIKPEYEDQNQLFKLSNECEVTLGNGEPYFPKGDRDGGKKKNKIPMNQENCNIQ